MKVEKTEQRQRTAISEENQRRKCDVHINRVCLKALIIRGLSGLIAGAQANCKRRHHSVEGGGGVSGRRPAKRHMEVRGRDKRGRRRWRKEQQKTNQENQRKESGGREGVREGGRKK